MLRVEGVNDTITYTHITGQYYQDQKLQLLKDINPDLWDTQQVDLAAGVIVTHILTQ